MKKIVFYLLTGLFSFSVYGQRLNIKKIEQEIYLSQHDAATLDSICFDLPPIKNSRNLIHIRVSFINQVVDFFSENGEQFEAILTNRTTQIHRRIAHGRPGNYTKKKKKIVYQKTALDEGGAAQIYTALISSNQQAFPTDTLIPGWRKNFRNCATYSFEYKIEDTCLSTSYFCTKGQDDTIHYKTIIERNVELIRETFHLDSLYQFFESQLPNGYSYPRGNGVFLYKLTRREAKKHEKETTKRAYSETVKDTIDNLLNLALTNKIKDSILEDSYCINDFEVTINKKGQVKKITIPKYDKPRYNYQIGFWDYFEKKRDLGKCKKLLKEKLKNCDLAFLELHYEVKRGIIPGIESVFEATDPKIIYYR
ncbi:MAG: hypothetical protein LAT76_08380 [Schleiferiaceae bacterium]|nr:hypothetical protein [Schleiferiaceae bacterium]